MTGLKARDLMTPEVVTVPPETSVTALARLLAERGISAVPVVDGRGTLCGIVTEADLIRRLAGEEDEQPGWLSRLFADEVREADRYARTHGATARDIMSEQVVTVGPDAPASTIARLMEERGVRRVVVTADGRLRGIVSRADLLRALAAPPAEGGEYPDARIRAAVTAAMKRQPWADTFHTVVDVKGGVVELHGFSRSPAGQRGLRVLAESVPGVKGVVDHTQPMPPALFSGV